MQLCFQVAPGQAGRLLGECLRAWGLSATLIKHIKQETGGFFAGQQAIRTCDRVAAGQRICFMLPPEPPTTVEPEPIDFAIAYESRHVLVAEKPAGMAVHPTLNYKNATLANAYMGLLQSRGETGVFRPVNRIDVGTSGLVLCAKNAYAAPLLAQSAQKLYRAVVEGAPPQPSGCIEAPIDRAPGSIILRCVSPKGKPSRTEYAVEAATGAHSLVAAVPVTGRTHQLRVHFAHVGCPLAGDELYGGHRGLIDRHALHCARLCFTEPGGEGQVTVESPLPADMRALLDL